MPQEVLLTTSSSPDSSILIHDLHTSNHIQSFRQSTTAQNGLTFVNRQFLAAQVNKGIIHVYSWGKDAIEQKMILPEKIRSLRISPSGSWCAGGSESGRLFLWEVNSGNLMFAREAHYQPLTQITFSLDEALVFTGGEDAVVHTWRTMDLVDLDLRSEEVMPLSSWNEHTLAITGIVCGTGTAMNARMFTSSLDKTVKVFPEYANKVWDVSSLSLMTTILFPSPVTTFTVEPAERALFVGTSSSVIYQFNLIQNVGSKVEAVGGDPSHPLHTDSKNEYHGHTAEISAIALSFDASLLVSGDQSGEIFIWDIGSRQVLRKIKGHKGPITSAHIFLKPEDSTPTGETQQFKRVQNERGRADHDIWMTIPNQRAFVIEDDAEMAGRGLLSLTNEGSESKLKSRVLELEDELQRVYGAYGDLKGIHEKLWSKYVDEKMQE